MQFWRVAQSFVASRRENRTPFPHLFVRCILFRGVTWHSKTCRRSPLDHRGYPTRLSSAYPIQHKFGTRAVGLPTPTCVHADTTTISGTAVLGNPSRLGSVVLKGSSSAHEMYVNFSPVCSRGGLASMSFSTRCHVACTPTQLCRQD